MTALSDSRNVEGKVSAVGDSGDSESLSDVFPVLLAQSGRLAMIIEFVAIIVQRFVRVVIFVAVLGALYCGRARK